MYRDLKGRNKNRDEEVPPLQGNGAYLVPKTFWVSRLRRFGPGTVSNNS